MAYASVIAGSAVIRGNVRGDTSLEILGRVEGDVGVTGDVSIGPDAVIVGTVSGARVLIGGSVEGDVSGSEAVVVAETGRVIGDLVAPRVGMSEGASVRGNVRTEGAAPVRSAPRAVAEPRLAPVERPRPVVAAAPPPPPLAVAVPAGNTPKPPPAAAAPKKAPPPPVIPAPRPGVRARKKVARR